MARDHGDGQGSQRWPGITKMVKEMITPGNEMMMMTLVHKMVVITLMHKVVVITLVP